MPWNSPLTSAFTTPVLVTHMATQQAILLPTDMAWGTLASQQKHPWPLLPVKPVPGMQYKHTELVEIKVEFQMSSTMTFYLIFPVRRLDNCCHLVAKLCPTLFAASQTIAHQVSLSMGIFQARILERVAISFSKGPSWPRDWTRVSYIGKGILYHWATGEVPIG